MDRSLDELLTPWVGEATEVWLVHKLIGSVGAWLDEDPRRLVDIDRVTVVVARAVCAQYLRAGRQLPVPANDLLVARVACAVVEVMALDEDRAIELICSDRPPVDRIRLLDAILGLDEPSCLQPVGWGCRDDLGRAGVPE